jgi:hypothetical protein
VSTVQWFTLLYVTASGQQIWRRNLQAAGADSIERAQAALGSRDFRRVRQNRHYSQQELDLLKVPT